MWAIFESMRWSACSGGQGVDDVTGGDDRVATSGTNDLTNGDVGVDF